MPNCDNYSVFLHTATHRLYLTYDGGRDRYEKEEIHNACLTHVGRMIEHALPFRIATLLPIYPQ